MTNEACAARKLGVLGSLCCAIGVLAIQCGTPSASGPAASAGSGGASAGSNAANAGAASRAARAGAAGAGDDGSNPAAAGDSGQPTVEFRKLTLHRQFYCEGATSGDIDGDGVIDVIAGPDWYAGPDFSVPHAIWPRTPFDVKGYSDCFFEFTYDFNADGRLDVLVVGFPGQAAYWYENPSADSSLWLKHAAVTVVDGESPAFTDLTGDGKPELVFMREHRLGFAQPTAGSATLGWAFRPLSAARDYSTFTHGLGVGDLDGDGRADVVEATGYFSQPPSLSGDPEWPRCDQAFGLGGAQMLVEDLNQDGRADLLTTIAAHGYGLSWFEQLDGACRFAEHEIVPAAVPAADASVIIHEPHALATADLDGDGLSDLISGERFWGHVPEGTPDFSAPARLYWFRRTLTGDGPRFTPALIDADSGVGTQISVADLDRDGRPDLVISNKKGAFVFLQVP